MKKAIKILVFIVGGLLIVLSATILCVNVFLSNVKLDEKKLINLDKTISYYDCNGNVFLEESNGVSVSQEQKIPEHTKNAFIAIEDKRFYSHNGIDYRALFRATFNNVKTFSLKEGASTISQQLVKNTHLSSEKTIKRKLKEIKLTKELEKKYSKNEILEKYLNTIYFGSSCYGISSASKYYFNKNCEDLTVNESAILAAIIKAPSIYSPTNNIEKCFCRKQLVLKEMYAQGFIDEKTYSENLNKEIQLDYKDNDSCEKHDYASIARKECCEVLEKNPYKKGEITIKTYYNPFAQEIIEKCIADFNDVDCDKSAILINKSGRVVAYSSSCAENYRQLGSIIKPIAVYAPAVENDTINPQTLLLDEKTDFNGYAPSNFNDKYYGSISACESLAKSSNVCAAKILNYSGLDNAVTALNKVGIKTDESDKNLSLALGATKYGATLRQITCAYNLFLNGGVYYSPSIVDEINTSSGKIFQNTVKKVKVFNSDTTSIMNYMLSNVVTDGTAKKLDALKKNIYAKTGTVGNKNGNTDAYIISYNSDYVLGVWLGAKNNQLLSNQITGGTLPATLSANFWQEFYKNDTPPNKIEEKGVIEIALDKISYEQENKILLADQNTPERYKLNGIFKKNNLPKESSNRFSRPCVKNLKYTVINNEITVQLCQIEYIDYLVYKTKNGTKELVYDTKNNKKEYSEKLEYSCEYQYSVIPYFNNGKEIFYGDEVFFDKIKTPNKDLLGDDWWHNDFE